MKFVGDLRKLSPSVCFVVRCYSVTQNYISAPFSKCKNHGLCDNTDWCICQRTSYWIKMIVFIPALQCINETPGSDFEEAHRLELLAVCRLHAKSQLEILVNWPLSYATILASFGWFIG